VNRPLVQIAILLFVGLSLGAKSIAGQSAPTAVRAHAEAPCPLSIRRDKKQAVPEISIIEVTFTGSLQLPRADQAQIAQSIREASRGTSFDDVMEEALERARAGWQNRGYFAVRLIGDAKVRSSSPVSRNNALNVQILEEGAKYTLARIAFTNNKAIDVQDLRRLFSLKDGDIFSQEKIATGLENLRHAYEQLGYIDVTAMPNTVVNKGANLISVEIDIDEGVQFYLTNVEILGVDESSRTELLKDAPVGQVYNQRLIDLFLKKHASIFKFSSADPLYIARRVDEKAGTMEVSLDVGPCPLE
jgi:outer membrane protein assembly factor BamA